MKRFLSVFSVLIVIAAGCATAPPPNPFHLPKEEFNARIKTVALIPVALPQRVDNAENVKHEFKTHIMKKLEERGWLVIPSREWRSLWEKGLEQVGPLFDPLTGKMNEGKYKAVRDYCFRELKANFRVDGFLSASVRPVPVKTRSISSEAKWDGVAENPSLLGTGPYYDGTMEGLALFLQIEDPNQVTIFANRGGIQLTVKTHRYRIVEVYRPRILADREKNFRAVEIALAPILSRR